jgi:CheY-like chemotaxis protein
MEPGLSRYSALRKAQVGPMNRLMETALTVLVAEDDLGDVLLLQRAFTKAGVKQPVFFARDGQEVMDYLEGVPPFDNPVLYPLPNLLLLDLKLPGVSGFEVLDWLRGHVRLRHLLVVVFSNSDRPEDVQRAYALGANSYIIKPRDPDELVHLVGRLQNYWAGINVPPPQEAQMQALLPLQ